ncbi:uncharacterized protein N7511_011540 [Penicillium nucicola]|uniref:uncharacterized protein n=1 Tax=Penicillium nucicola TaxID=1850975 RepID=UPI0025457CB7|nr:uncharacterized protein N7511_011540 [Penicillium nucicola]KAJ5742521.1 hypothetical protein N7511_011540 [Penicillium nucicola]
MQIKTEGVPAGRENQLRTERRFGESIEHSQESVTVDHPSSSHRAAIEQPSSSHRAAIEQPAQSRTLHQATFQANEVSTPSSHAFCLPCLIYFDFRLARKNKDVRRSITLKGLAADFDDLKREVQGLKNMLVSSHPGPNEQYQKQRVSFEDPVSQMIYK